MKRIRIAVPRSPKPARAGAIRGHQDAAIQLVRLEFDMGRLRRSIEQAERRCAMDRRDYKDKDRQREALMKILGSQGH